MIFLHLTFKTKNDKKLTQYKFYGIFMLVQFSQRRITITGRKMINIFDNFVELQNTTKLNQAEFSKKFDTNILVSAELIELDNLITSLLKDFPQLYPNILYKTPDNNQRNKSLWNQRAQTQFESEIKSGSSTNEAIKPYISKKYTKKFLVDNPNILSDNELNELITPLLKDLSTDATINDIKNEIKRILDKHFIHKDLDYLARLISKEVYFRTLVPEEYVWSDKFEEFEKSYEAFFNEFEQKLTSRTKSMLRNKKETDEITKYLKSHLFK